MHLYYIGFSIHKKGMFTFNTIEC